MLGQHIRCRLENSAFIANSLEKRRLVASTILSLGQPYDLMSFGLADTHLHMGNAGDRDGTELARRVEISLTLKLKRGVGFRKVKVTEVHDQWHLERVFGYVLEQDEHHEVHADPLREATNIPDLLGMRVTGRYTIGNVRKTLPRVSRARLLRLLGVDELVPADGPLEHIEPAAAAALCLPDLAGRSELALTGKRAVIKIVGDRLNTTQLGDLLGLHRTTINRLRRRPVDFEVVKATRLQLGHWRSRWELMHNAGG